MPVMARFNEWLDEEGLIDLPIPNHKFTWSNMREDPAMAKLDRVVVDGEWEERFPCCSVLGLPRTTSDHIPLLLQGGLRERRKRMFRFESWWTLCPDLEEVVRGSWEAGVGGYRGARCVAVKLRRLKRVLRVWGRQRWQREQRGKNFLWL
ncbi:hypothetical protein QJS10_CPB04g01551 [Acorus calamus]|uniref:Endonuclease/exonuclease/phosphatase domain-containing protein n=1 Tax=Acorus calamus TaxID=4465 RepID=A0AAV9F101_ACOCL|nr:hypothetical protein QJS10_CPB04g01551 [Acorus calamus]